MGELVNEAEPVGKEGFGGVAPGDVHFVGKLCFGEVADGAAGFDVVADEALPGGAEVVYRQFRRARQRAFAVELDVAAEFFEQAAAVVFGVPLEVDLAEAVGRGRHCHAAFFARNQYRQAARAELFGADAVPARVRHVEAGVDVGEHRVAAVQHAVAENAKEFFVASLARDAVEVL